jgi:hypothetical protein
MLCRISGHFCPTCSLWGPGERPTPEGASLLWPFPFIIFFSILFQALSSFQFLFIFLILFQPLIPRTSGSLAGLERMIELQLVATGQAAMPARGVVPAKVSRRLCYLVVCVCMRACVRVRVRVRVRVHARARVRARVCARVCARVFTSNLTEPPD